MDTTSQYADWVLNPPLPERPTRPRCSYFICGTPRCGSWMLCGLLASTGVAGRPHEWFWADTEQANKQTWGISRYSDYLRLVHDAGTTPNGIFGSKLMWGYTDRFLAELKQLGNSSSDLTLIERHFPDPRFVWLRRQDATAQAVSWAKATQTGYWHHWDTPTSHPALAYGHEQVDALAREASAHNAAWRSWFSANEIEPLAVWFEELVADPVGVTRAALRHLGVASERVTVRELTVTSHDRLNEESLASYQRLADD